MEEQFYLLWPSIAKKGVHWLKLISALLIPFSYFWLYVLIRTGTSLEQGVWTNSIVQFQFFGIGALIALQLHGRTPKLTGAARAARLVTGVALWLVASGYFHVFGSRESVEFWRVSMGYGCVAMGCGLLCLGILGAPSGWFPETLVFLGKISYGLYVFHLLGLRVSYTLAAHLQSIPAVSAIVRWLNIPIALGFTVTLAYLSYRFFETPFLQMKERFTFVKSRGI